MFSQYFSNIDGISLYPMIGLLLFVPFFLGILLVAARMKREHADHMSKLPLDEDAALGTPSSKDP